MAVIRRKFWTLTAVFIIVIVAGCSVTQFKADMSTTLPATLGASESYQVIYGDKKYQLLKSRKDAEGNEKYIVRIFDDENNVIHERSYPVSRLAPSVTELDNDILRITLGVGTGLNYTHFFDRKNKRSSPEYTTPLLVGNGKVVVPQRGKLVVSDMFDHSAFYKEILIEDLAPVANPVDAFGEIRWVSDRTLFVTYLSGKKGEDYARKTVIWDLNE